ncbi:MAG: thiamine pyrophosphate-binding protein [Deltaproteobacteria bacterium]|nr:thiamine pyrophosphate-binding protein [Deltaproteobacteria bacterium]
MARRSTSTALKHRPEDLGTPRMRWGSDVVAAVARELDFKYIALVPGASYRGFHDSLVNFLGNENPQMVTCLHEEHAVSIADGYGKATDEPMAVALHSNVGLMHATMTIFNAWCDRTPMVIFGATGPVDAHKRRPWIDWIHTAADQGAIIRNYIKWDDQPASPQAAVESVLRANQIARTAPFGPVYVCLDVGLQEESLHEDVRIPDASRYAAPKAPFAPSAVVKQAREVLKKAKFPVILMGRMSRGQADWDRRVKLAEALNAPVLTSSNDPSSFPTTHPLHLAAPALRPSKQAVALVKKADVILSLDWLDLAGYLRGCLGASQTQTPADKTIIHCSMDTYRTNGWSMDHQALPAADIPVAACPDTLVEQMLEGFGRKRPAAGLKAITHWTRTPVGRARPKEGVPMTLMDMALTVREFARSRPVSFARLPIGWPGEAAEFSGPLSFMGNDGGGGVGSGPGHAVGTALALQGKGRLVTGVLGDGDYLMGCNALWTATHMDLPLLIVIADNRSYYNDEMHQERVAVMRERPVQNRWIGQRLDDPPVDLIAMGRAQGFDGEAPVSTAEDLAAALERGAQVVSKGGRYVIDALVEPGYADTGADQRADMSKKKK